MGWLTDAAENADAAGSWGMNDAARDSDSSVSRIAWFQVTLTQPASSPRPLPAQPFLHCVRDVTEHLGTVRMDAAQMVLPMPSRDESSRTQALLDLMQSAGWFTDLDPQRRTPILLTIDTGPGQAVGSMAQIVFERLRTHDQSVFSCDSFSVAGRQVADLTPALPDQLWQDSKNNQVLFSGSIAEWSLDALGWVATFVAEASSDRGLTHPLLLTARRA